MDHNRASHIDGTTSVFGILGYPVSHSLSPRIHNAAFQFLKYNGVYVPFPVEKPGAALLKSLSALHVKGLSVTIPHKAWAAKAAESRDELSERCGAANTLIRGESGEMKAFNTDGPGALRALRTREPMLRGKRFLILGYGGSATAIAHSLLIDENPALLVVAGRNATKRRDFTRELAETYRDRRHTLVRSTDFSDLRPDDIDIVIQTTPLGMQGQEKSLPLPEEFVQKYHTVFDIVYTPARTPLLALAERRGAKTVQGYLMLLYQAVIQFELFTGLKAPENLMEKELLQALRSRG